MSVILEEVNALSIEELKTRLEQLELPITGGRSVLRERLKGVLMDDDETNQEELTNSQVNAMKKPELVNRLRELSLKTTGKKDELRSRLKAALEINEDESDDETEEGSEDGNDNLQGSEASNRGDQTDRAIHRPHPTLSFKDVEDALETFSGDGNKNFHRYHQIRGNCRIV